MTQMSLHEPAPLTPRERRFAEFIAGWSYPGRGGFDHLLKAERDACLEAAQVALAIAETPKATTG